MHFWLHHTAHCAEKIVSVRLCTGSVSEERVGWGGGGGRWGHLQGDIHMMGARLGFERAMVVLCGHTLFCKGGKGLVTFAAAACCTGIYLLALHKR